MILKKPYAFLIKHFKMIHLIIGVILGVVAYLSKNIITFFQDYINAGYRLSSTYGLKDEYIPVFLIGLVLFAIALLVTLLVLMLHKKKPNKLYIFTIIYYVIFLVGLIILRGILGNFEFTLMEAKAARSIRDIIVVVYIPQFIFIICMLYRSTGFSLKKFDFQSDLRELSLDATDAQEIEVNLEIDYDKIFMKIKHIFRELKYYLRENKFVMVCLVAVLVVAIGAITYKAVTTNYDRTFGMNADFTYQDIKFNIQDAIVTNINYNGEVIEEGSYYVVLDVKSTNTSNRSKRFDYNSMKLQIGRNTYTPDLAINKYFIDYLPGTVVTVLTSLRENHYALIYKIPETSKNKSMKLKLYNGTASTKDGPVDKFIYVNLKKKVIEEKEEIVGNYSLNQEINLEGTYLGKTTFKVSKMEITDVYPYTYKSCSKQTSKCNTYKDKLSVSLNTKSKGNKLLIMKIEYNEDLETNYAEEYITANSFISNFGNIEYQIGNESFVSEAVDVTPLNAQGFVAYEVPENIRDASIIQLTVVIRNQKYFITLFEK